jgi:hypothetical protein
MGGRKEERKGKKICERILAASTERNSGGNKHLQMPALCVLFGVNGFLRKCD